MSETQTDRPHEGDTEIVISKTQQPSESGDRAIKLCQCQISDAKIATDAFNQREFQPHPERFKPEIKRAMRQNPKTPKNRTDNKIVYQISGLSIREKVRHRKWRRHSIRRQTLREKLEEDPALTNLKSHVSMISTEIRILRRYRISFPLYLAGILLTLVLLHQDCKCTLVSICILIFNIVAIFRTVYLLHTKPIFSWISKSYT